MLQRKDVHIISENDLQGLKHSGRRMRAKCPIHYGNERHLSIAAWSEDMDEEDERLAGWGFCHSANCGATVLVQEWNPKAAAWYLGHPVEAGIPRHAISCQEREQAEEWQLAELAALDRLYPRMQAQLTHARVQAYLADRGLQDMTDLLTELGIGYIPPLSEWDGALSIRKGDTTVKVSLKKWCDRIIFPYETREGTRGYLGRALHLWMPGLDENEHKKLLEENEVIRYVKTYKGGYIHKAALTKHKHIYLCEGPFDLIPLLHVGIENALAVAGVEIDVHAIPTSVRSVTLAFDADLKADGKGKAIARGCEKLGYAGIAFDFLSPPDDGLGKDWSERYRLHGTEGLALLTQPFVLQDESRNPDEQLSTEEAAVSEACADCGTHISDLERDFFYWQVSKQEARCYCVVCRDPETGESRPKSPVVVQDESDQDTRKQRFMALVERVAAAALPGPVDIEIMPGTADEYIARRKQELAEALHARWAAIR
jgi:hypothetical protein